MQLTFIIPHSGTEEDKNNLTRSFDLYLFLSCLYKCICLYSEVVSPLTVTVTEYLEGITKEKKGYFWLSVGLQLWSHCKEHIMARENFRDAYLMVTRKKKEEGKKKSRRKRRHFLNVSFKGMPPIT